MLVGDRIRSLQAIYKQSDLKNTIVYPWLDLSLTLDADRWRGAMKGRFNPLLSPNKTTQEIKGHFA